MRQIVRTDRVHELTTPSYSHAVRAGPWLCVAGQVARAPDGSIVGFGDVAAQTRQALDNIRALVEAGGGTLDDVVRVVVYIRDMNDFKAIHEVRSQYFAQDPPASTMVEVSRLVNDDMLIEIEATALVSS